MVKAGRDHVGFLLTRSQLRGRIILPKYYDHEIDDQLAVLGRTHELVRIGSLIEEGHLSVSTGDEIGKMAYGTGEIPFVRTSDIGNWEIKTNPKQGVSEEIFEKYALKQDVRAGDIMLVRDGTYLIGQSCLVTPFDIPCLYQSHILKLRVAESSPVSAPLLFACLNTAIVKTQIRARQFTSDIIDTIGNRYLDIQLPIPRDKALAERVAKEVEEVARERVGLREKIRKFPLWFEGIIPSLDAPLPNDWLWRDEATGSLGFTLRRSKIRGRILLPKYYDPRLVRDLRALGKTHDLATLGELVDAGTVSWKKGIEVGKMAYATGSIPFIRTSDMGNWELKADPKQNVSEEIYEAAAQDVRGDDIFVVIDGTYLVGSSCILTEHDARLLYCGGIYKLRVERKDEIDPYLLLAALSCPVVRRQMRAKQFTRDIIDTIGRRIFEVVLPLPREAHTRKRIAAEAREVVERRGKLRNRAQEISREVVGEG